MSPSVSSKPSSYSGQDSPAIARIVGEVEDFLRHYTPRHASAQLPENLLNGHYRIDPDLKAGNPVLSPAVPMGVRSLEGEPLPVYAAVCDPGLPYRHTSMEKLLHFEHDNLIKIVDHGIARISSLGEERNVLIFQQPRGRRLLDALVDGLKFSEQTLTEQILMPLCAVLSHFEEMNLSHCRIHPDNIFIGKKMLLGECVSAPAGYSQEFYYEPVERISAMPHGKGGGSIRVDFYAIGVLVVDVLHGLGKLRQLSREQVTSRLLTQGSYNAIASGLEFSEHMHDLLRGTLNDNPVERWGPTQLRNWLTGKRYNIIHPSLPRDGTRPFQFEGQDFFSRKALAHSLFTQWDKAKSFLRASKLDKWLVQSVQDPALSDLFLAAIATTGGQTTKSRKENNELLSRTLAIIDPTGPIRAQHISFNVDATGKVLSEALYHKRHSDLAVLSDLITNDLPHYWSERQDGRLTADVQESLWKLQNSRIALGNAAFGFGIERCLYDLNTELPCFSGVVKGYYVDNLKTMLRTLDLIAKSPATLTLLDRHLIAFIAAKLNLTREVRFTEMARIKPSLASSVELKCLSIVARAQERSGERDLKGLTAWATLRLISLLECVHSRKIRENLASRIRSHAESGDLQTVLAAALDMTLLERDETGYRNAHAVYRKNMTEIDRLRDRQLQQKATKGKGRRLATSLSLVLLLIAGSIALQPLFG